MRRAGLTLTDGQFAQLLEGTPYALAMAQRLRRDHGCTDEPANKLSFRKGPSGNTDGSLHPRGFSRSFTVLALLETASSAVADLASDDGNSGDPLLNLSGDVVGVNTLTVKPLVKSIQRYFRRRLNDDAMEELLSVHGIIVPYEAIRQWCQTFDHA